VRPANAEPSSSLSLIVENIPVSAQYDSPWTAARRMRPLVSGEAIRATVSKEPAEKPASVTLPGSPPKPAMLSCTQRSAAI
jgi:hypothetical protein